jgi:hypothetical protein
VGSPEEFRNFGNPLMVPLLDPIRDAPQFKQIERQLKFPP